MGGLEQDNDRKDPWQSIGLYYALLCGASELGGASRSSRGESGELRAVRRRRQGDTLRVKVKVRADVVTRPMCTMRPRQQQWDKASILCYREGSVSRVE
jgi:hypothetical protein